MLGVSRNIFHHNPFTISSSSATQQPWQSQTSPVFLSTEVLSSLQPYLSQTYNTNSNINEEYDPQLFPTLFDIDDGEDQNLLTNDEFFMYKFKVQQCTRAEAHEWTSCPYAHAGEKAARRDPRLHSGTPCPEFRKLGRCSRGPACTLSHGVFECWLHPDRYRTRACRDGAECKRPVCFFAHNRAQLRKTKAPALEAKGILPSPVDSPPVSPGGYSVDRDVLLLEYLKKLQISSARQQATMEMIKTVEETDGDDAPDVGWVTELIS